MRIFFDTSALVKKYIDEPGAAVLEEAIKKATGIVVSPIYIIEVVSFIQRKFLEGRIEKGNVNAIRKKAFEDYMNFENIVFSPDVQHKAIELVGQYPLKSLDAIQLASGVIARPDLFVTSDKQLFKYAKHELKRVQLI